MFISCIDGVKKFAEYNTSEYLGSEVINYENTGGILHKTDQPGKPVLGVRSRSNNIDAFALNVRAIVVDLRCLAAGAPGIKGDVEWKKLNGELPYAYTIRDGGGILHLKDIKRKDEGVYKCTVRTKSGMATTTHVRLKVSDFVPLFNGDGYMELKPLTDEQWSDVNMEVSIRPKKADGLIMYTERHNEDNENEINNYLGLGLRDGYVFYRYNVGNEPVEITSTYPIRMDEWHKIEITNEPGKAVLKVDDDDINEKDNRYFNTAEGIAGVVSVGGTRDQQVLVRSTFAQPFVGTISSLIISDETMDFGDESVVKSSNVKQSTDCLLGFCQHNAICIPANVHRGFRCDCSTTKGYDGEFCERKTTKCDYDFCTFGTCVKRADGSQYCRCPPGKYGDQCQLSESTNLLQSIQFDGKNSYLALSKPNTLRNFSLKMQVEPRSTNDQLLAFVASDYNPKKANYLALAIRDGKFVHLYNSGDGIVEIESPEEVMSHESYYLDLKRFGHRAEFRVNGKKIPNRSKLAPFVAGTNLFIGGTAPGITVNPKVGGAAPFIGCISKIILNGNEINLAEAVEKSSSGVTECKQLTNETGEQIETHPAFIWTTTPSTTRTTIHITTSRYPQTKPAWDLEAFEKFEGREVTTKVAPVETLQTTACAGEGCSVRCEPDTCGDHGICETINATHIACNCRDYYDGPNCEFFKPIEHAAKFDGKAFIVFSADDFPHLSSEKEESLDLRFRTSASFGLIFWQGQQPGTPLLGEDYMSVGLNDGYLVFSYELGGGVAQITSTETVNDDKEHRLRIWRKGRTGTMVIDEGAPIEGISGGILAMLNVEGDIFIGGVPDLDSMTGGLHEENFVGCIADITFNGIKMDLMANAIDGRNVKPCDQWMTKKKWLRNKKYRWRRYL